MNTLFRKGYLLAGVMMAANMLAVNEVKAMKNETAAPPLTSNPMITSKNKGIHLLSEMKEQGDTNPPYGNAHQISNEKIKKMDIQTTEKFNQEQKKQDVQNFFDRFLSLENYANFFGSLALSGANNYFKWWNYDAGRYREFGCVGYRTKRFLNDMLQLEVNLNVIRGVLWLIPGSLFFVVQGYSNHKINTACSFTFSLLLFLTINNGTVVPGIEKKLHTKVIAFLFSILQGFASAPLTFHLSKFSISISLDSIIWELVAKWARKKVELIQTNIEILKIEEREKRKEEGKKLRLDDIPF